MKRADTQTERLLRAELDEITERLRAKSAVPSVSVAGADFFDIAQSRVEGQELVRLGVSRLSERAKRLHVALRRLPTGEYGVCSQCGDPISPRRLEALPEVTTCVACQAKLEDTA
jgi:RNA polymerase-binding transcription factor DksA